MMWQKHAEALMARRKKEIQIGIRNEQELKHEVMAAWKAAERGEAPKEPVERIYFTDVANLLKTLTNRRFELLQALRRQGPLSTRALSQALKRDYKNVHTDVKALEHIGLIEADKDGRFHVPWDRIATEIELAA